MILEIENCFVVKCARRVPQSYPADLNGRTSPPLALWRMKEDEIRSAYGS